MEVIVQSAEGAVQEKDSILSIRAGSSRRQGAVQANKAIHFPVSIAQAQPFKVDFLRQVCAGETTIPITGWESLSRTVELRSAGAAGEKEEPAMLVDLRIVAKPQACGRGRVATNAAGPEGKALDMCEDQEKASAVQVRRYFDDHNLMPVVQALLEAIVREKPADPRDFIARYMESVVISRDQTDESEPSALDQTMPDPEPEPAAAQTLLREGDVPAADAQRDRTLSEYRAVFQRHSPSRSDGNLDEESFSAAIRDVHPCLSAAQSQALGKGVAPGGEGITFAAFCAAADAVAVDTAVAAEVAGLDAKTFANLGSTAATEAALEAALAGDSQPPAELHIHELREKCATTLLKVCDDGRLEEVLAGVFGKPQPQPTAAEAQAAAAAERERHLKAKVRQVLISASESGLLEKVLDNCAGHGSFAAPATAATSTAAAPPPPAPKAPEPRIEAAEPAALKAAAPVEPAAAATAPGGAIAFRPASPGLLARLNEQSQLMARQRALVDELRDLTERLGHLQQANMAAAAPTAFP